MSCRIQPIACDKLHRVSLAVKTHTHVHCIAQIWPGTPSFNTRRHLKKPRMQAITRATVSSAPVKSAQQKQCSEQTMKDLVAFLEKDLPHLFDEQGIDKRMYESKIEFRDPITRYETLDGYLFNIMLLRLLFRPIFLLHAVKPTGPNEITTRWTMVMNFRLLPWKPQLVFTGVSVLDINPETGKFCRHVDYWDSIKENDYFSFEGFVDILKQLRIYKTPDLETPNYKILKRTAAYEVREYEPFIVAETNSDRLTGSSGFGDVAGYIFGKNSTKEKMAMTTPVFTQMAAKESQDASIQFVLPLQRKLSELPRPLEERVKLRKTEESLAAVLKFSGKATEEVVWEKERYLRSCLAKDGLQAKAGSLLARYNDPNRTPEYFMRNEVIVWLYEFSIHDHI